MPIDNSRFVIQKITQKVCPIDDCGSPAEYVVKDFSMHIVNHGPYCYHHAQERLAQCLRAQHGHNSEEQYTHTQLPRGTDKWWSWGKTKEDVS